MEVTSWWLPALAVIAGPAAAALVYARQSKRNPRPVAAPLPSLAPDPGLVLARPLRWYHCSAGGALAALPFVQYYGYIHFGSSAAFFVPLAAAMALLMLVSIIAPRAVNVAPLDHREWLLWFGVILGGLAAALLLPATGTILALRGALIDIAAYSLTTLLIRRAHRRRFNVSST